MGNFVAWVFINSSCAWVNAFVKYLPPLSAAFVLVRTCLNKFFARAFPSLVCQKPKEIPTSYPPATYGNCIGGSCNLKGFARNVHHPNICKGQNFHFGLPEHFGDETCIVAHVGCRFSNHTLSRGCSIPPCCKARRLRTAAPCCERSFSTFFEPRPFGKS